MNALDFEIVEATNVKFVTLLPVFCGSSVELEERVTTLEGEVVEINENILTIENSIRVYKEAFAPRINPIFYNIHRPQGDRGSNCISNSYIKTTSAGMFFIFDILYYNYVATSSIQQGFPLNSVMFLFPRPAVKELTQYNQFVNGEFTPHKTAEEMLEEAGCSVGTLEIVSPNASINANPRSIISTRTGEIVVNSNYFISSNNDIIIRLRGEYEIASDWTFQEFNSYEFPALLGGFLLGGQQDEQG